METSGDGTNSAVMACLQNDVSALRQPSSCDSQNITLHAASGVPASMTCVSILHSEPVEYASSPHVRHCVLPVPSVYSRLVMSQFLHSGDPSKNENLAIGQVRHCRAISFEVEPGLQLVQLTQKKNFEEKLEVEKKI